ncbi:predicted protein [Chaetomium globosum CBS 148.51]|uniref:Uncharacterized protein n=1 Tax=Chaetomium globosum (strain ATCC 6205 / CBS 148.51 / DSM 1962 / NBRC 6347 / NRRL 1970) TaxID=306901 RepID=Q2GT03_CHAGB|nr:uncharacterized protein CHGG_08901 [Chaetomium globosum CBS 148.51]EAQ84887.1 predicted protein [Chaetomium globosum CBS 148.51]
MSDVTSQTQDPAMGCSVFPAPPSGAEARVVVRPLRSSRLFSALVGPISSSSTAHVLSGRLPFLMDICGSQKTKILDD